MALNVAGKRREDRAESDCAGGWPSSAVLPGRTIPTGPRPLPSPSNLGNVDGTVTAAATRPRISLIENFANGAAGHWGDNLVRLCNGATAAGYEPIAVTVHGLHPQVRDSLAATGAVIVDRPVGFLARASLWASRFLRPAHGFTYRIAPRSDLPPRVRYASRGLAEIAALRTSTRVAGQDVEATVILTASQGLAATTAGLSRTPHLRFVHYKGTPEGVTLRALEKIFARSGRSIAVIATNASIASTTKQRHPDRLVIVRSFAVADPNMYIGDDERRPARSALGIAETEFVVAMVGGWWPYKDIETIKRALELRTRPVTLVVCGKPVRPSELEPALARCGGRVVNLAGAVTEDELRRIYAASDVALVTRTPGWPEEIGTAFDAARYGVPLIVSDHDEDLSRRLTAEPWVRLFRVGDPQDLARTIEGFAETPPPRPDHGAAERLGLTSATDTIAAFCRIALTLPERRSIRFPGTTSAG
jgi:glycosyltransferase involved in cell wall biosynthesis